MAGITYEQVADAAAAIVAEGEHPSIIPGNSPAR